MANPTYMDGQTEIQWEMRRTLVDWLLQVHLRYHMLPETLWIAVNIVDRFLSKRVVSLVKLQLVGLTAMFIAAKYEEIMAPSVDEFVFMAEAGYTREEILKGERIILTVSPKFPDDVPQLTPPFRPSSSKFHPIAHRTAGSEGSVKPTITTFKHELYASF